MRSALLSEPKSLIIVLITKDTKERPVLKNEAQIASALAAI